MTHPESKPHCVNTFGLYHLHTSADIALHLQLTFGLTIVVEQKKFASSLPRAREIDQYDCRLKGRSQGGVPKGDPFGGSNRYRVIARHPFKHAESKGPIFLPIVTHSSSEIPHRGCQTPLQNLSPRAQPSGMAAGRPVTNICDKYVFTHFVHTFCKHVLKTFSWLM